MLRTPYGVVYLGVYLGFASLLLVSCGGSGGEARRTRSVAALAAADLPECDGDLLATAGATLPTRRSEGHSEDPAVRQAAQRGLRFLGEDTIAWQTQHNCYGCHVQAVTFDAFVVGRQNHYDIPDEHFDEVLRGLLDVSGGARGPNGFSVGGDPNHLIESSKSFGGAAMAAYDEHVAADLSPVLIETAEAMLAYQNDDGSLISTDGRPPVVAGLMQSTTQAAQTWRQAYARSADERWLAPIARAEQYIRGRATQLTDGTSTYLQDLNYAIIGLLAAGATPNEAVVETLSAELLRRQHDEGGWGFTEGDAANAFATGQSLYVLKRLGTSDTDPRVRRGIQWLVEHQADNGAWTSGGDRRGAAMWAVLGLVSIDVLSIDVAGLADGTRLTAPARVRASAADADGRGARSVEIRVDDVPIGRSCASSLDVALDPSGLEDGAHRVDIIATDKEGKESRQRLSFYTGDFFLTQVGTRFEDGQTVLSYRNVADDGDAGRVRLRILDGAEDDARSVHEEVSASAPGPVTARWRPDGEARGSSAADEDAESARFVAELAYLDARGRVRQTVRVPFVHANEAQRAAQFARVAGRVGLAEEDMQGATVELVDERGNVVQSTSSTRSGRYRFDDVDQGNYRVRVRRRGLGVREAAVQAAPASEAAADLSF